MKPLDTRIECKKLTVDCSKSTNRTEQEYPYIIFEGVSLPPLMRARGVEATFGFGHGALYAHLNAGNIRSVAVRDKPNQRRATRLIYTASVIEFLRKCEEQSSESTSRGEEIGV